MERTEGEVKKDKRIQIKEKDIEDERKIKIIRGNRIKQKHFWNRNITCGWLNEKQLKADFGTKCRNRNEEKRTKGKR